MSLFVWVPVIELLTNISAGFVLVPVHGPVTRLISYICITIFLSHFYCYNDFFYIFHFDLLFGGL